MEKLIFNSDKFIKELVALEKKIFIKSEYYLKYGSGKDPEYKFLKDRVLNKI
jgi:hypothetical protein